MLRRPPTRRETTWAVLALVAPVLLIAYALGFLVDWQIAPVRSTLTVAFMAIGVVTAIPLLRATRADPPANLGLIDVERSARWPLRRELWAGRPGPVELRRYAAGWASRRLNRPLQGSAYLWLAGWLVATGSSHEDYPTGVWGWLFGAAQAVLLITGVASLVLRARAERVVEALEREREDARDGEVTAES
ncbi:hypothetical protein [Actinomycetospora sp.]|jgi:hypothetical protein|uniref:hypothetical protein n=1 Tax=Actinomycetospora sp. TaxID=1872135 RepID=UPI002F41E515